MLKKIVNNLLNKVVNKDYGKIVKSFAQIVNKLFTDCEQIVHRL